MLKLSNLNVTETFRKFKKNNILVGFLVPTKTGLEKSIMDATEEIRDLFSNNNIHNYDKQDKGTNYKVFIETTLIAKDEVIERPTAPLLPH